MDKKVKVDVVAVPLSGHLYPTMNCVAPLLNNPRYEVRLFTGLQKKALAEQQGFKVVPILEDYLEEFEQVANNDKKLGLIAAYRQLSGSLDVINHVSDQLEAEWRVNRPDVVVADFISLSAGLVAEQLGIPWITTMATQFAIETTDGPPCFFGGMGTPRNPLQVGQQWVGRHLTRLAKRSVAFLLRERLKRYDFHLYNDKGQETIYSPYSILGLGMREIELKSGFPDHYHWVGPMGGSIEQGADYPLNLSPYAAMTKVLVTSGTQLPWSKENLIAQTQALAVAHPDCQFFVTLGEGARDYQDESVSDNVRVLTYLPYKEYLPHMDYVIHHGGAGIFYQCIEYGKPALILAHDYDQYDYAVRGVEAGIAFSAKRDDAKAVGQAFEQLLAKTSWPEIAYLQEQATHYKATEILVQEIERLVADEE